MKKTTWPGNWKVACDVCGMWFPSGEMQKRWDGLVVCQKDFETRHPSTLYNYKAHTSVPSFIRKDPVDEFVSVCTAAGSSGYAELATAGCMMAENTSSTYEILSDMATNGHEERVPYRILNTDFSVYHEFPLIKSKIGIAQNLNKLGEGLENSLEYANELGVGTIFGNCEFDTYLKYGTDEYNPCLDQTLDGSGRPISMTDVPTSVFTNFTADVNYFNMVFGIQLTGPTPAYQPTTAAAPAKHPIPTNITADRDIVAKWIQSNKHAFPMIVSLWNEPFHTLTRVKQGKNPDGSVYDPDESDNDFIARQQTYTELANDALVDLYIGTFNELGARGISADSYAAFASLLSGDVRDGNGRDLPDGRVAMEAFFDSYSDIILSTANVTAASIVTCNDFGGRYTTITDGVDSYANGLDYPVIFTQGAESILKANNDGGGEEIDEDEEIAHEDIVCEMLTDLTSLMEIPSVLTACRSYWVGGKNGFLDVQADGTLKKTNKYYALNAFMSMPTTRHKLVDISIPFNGEKDDVLGLRGVVASSPTQIKYLFWNNSSSPVSFKLELKSPPFSLSTATVVLQKFSEEETRSVEEDVSLSQVFTIGSKEVWAFTISKTGYFDVSSRRNNLKNTARAGYFRKTTFTYKRPKQAFAYYDNIRDVGVLKQDGDFSGTLSTGVKYYGLADTLYATIFPRNISGSTTFTIKCKFHSGATKTLYTASTSSITPGTVVTLDLAAQAPAGWDAASYEGLVSLELSGAGNKTIVECYLSTSSTEANKINIGE